MDKEKILKLLKSGIWEDAYIAFVLMKDWTIEDVRNNFDLERGYKLHLEDSKHIQSYIKINDGLYMVPGGGWTIRFHETPEHGYGLSRFIEI